MAVAWQRTGARASFITPRPRVPFASAGNRPRMCDLLQDVCVEDRPVLVTSEVDARFEFGTERHRGHTYAELVTQNIPAGVPLIVSDDAAVWAAAASLATRNPLIGVLHSEGGNYLALAVTYATAAAALVCVSTRIERNLRRSLGATSTPIATVPCGTPLPPAPNRAARGPALRLAWVGRLGEEEKRVSDLPKIAAGLRAAATPFHIDIVGDGPDKEVTEGAMRAAGLEEHVVFHGWLGAESVRAVMSSTDVLLLPSNFEGMPVVVMEALALGCGVVASRVSGIEDIEHHPLACDCLFVHDVGDVESAVQYACRLWKTDPARRAQAARALAESELSIGVCVQRYAPIVARATTATDRRNASIGDATLSEFASLAVSTQRRARIWLQRWLNVESSLRAR